MNFRFAAKNNVARNAGHGASRHRFTIEQLEERQMLSISPNGDDTLLNDLVVHHPTTEGSSGAVVATDVNQVVVFAGQGPVDSQAVFAKVLAPDGQTTKATFRVNSTTQGVQLAPAVSADGQGNFVVVWAGRGVGDKSGIFLQRFDSTGTALGDETLVNSTTGGEQLAPALAVASDGSFVVTWQGMGDGDFSGVYLRRFSSDGTPLASEQLVNSATDDDQSAPSVAYNDAGEIVVAWQSRHQDGSDWGIYAQRFNTDGSRLGDETVLNSTTAGSQMAPKLATNPTGGLVAAWQSEGQDGDGWGVIARPFGDDGTPTTDEVILNDKTAGNQKQVAIAVAEDGQWLASWASHAGDSSGWEIEVKSFEEGETPADSVRANDSSEGHQQAPHVAVAEDKSHVIWQGGNGAAPSDVYGQAYDVTLVDNGPPAAPDIANIDDQLGEAGTELEVIVTATDANPRDTLTFTLDASNSPTGATIEKTGDRTAVIRWTPSAGDDGNTVGFRVIATDDGDPTQSDAEPFDVNVGDLDLSIDLNGPDNAGNDSAANFAIGGGKVNLISAGLSIKGADDGLVTGATAILAAAPDDTAESLSVDVLDTNITANYDSATRTLTLTGTDTQANYERVLRSLAYDNTTSNPSGDRSVEVSVADSTGSEAGSSATQTVTIATVAPNLIEFAKALTNAGVKFYGAAWCPDCTAQKQAFEDGQRFLPFVEVTNADRTPNQVGIDNNVTSYPTWEFTDGTRLEGEQTLQTIASRTGISIPTSDQPFLFPVENQTLLIGSPSHVALDGYDPNGGPLTYTVTSSNSDVTASIVSGNRSARIGVAGYGDMVFELFEQRAPRATQRMIDLADDDFYKDIIFHRVMNNFVIQGGDPDGNGTGGSTLGNFDDQFHADLQHNRTGLLSMAKTADDTNDSQFFITEGAQRHLDFNHTIFGILIEGESNRDAISNTQVGSANLPVTPVIMEGIDIFTDTENGTLMLEAAAGATGTADITVTVTDQNGNSFEQTFTVTLATDAVNDDPFLDDFNPVSVAMNMVAEVQLTSTDVEGDPVFYTATKVGTVDYTFTLSEAGLLKVTPPTDFVGTIEIDLGVGKLANSPDDNQRLSIEFT